MLNQRPYCCSCVSVAVIIPSQKSQIRKQFLPMKQQMKHNKLILLSHACNCKKFLWSECGSDYISLSQNKHGAKEKDIGRGGKPVTGPPSGNLTRSTVCLCKPWKSQGSDPSLVVFFLIKTNEALSAVADKYLMKRDRNRCRKTVVNKE